MYINTQNCTNYFFLITRMVRCSMAVRRRKKRREVSTVCISYETLRSGRGYRSVNKYARVTTIKRRKSSTFNSQRVNEQLPIGTMITGVTAGYRSEVSRLEHNFLALGRNDNGILFLLQLLLGLPRRMKRFFFRLLFPVRHRRRRCEASYCISTIRTSGRMKNDTHVVLERATVLSWAGLVLASVDFDSALCQCACALCRCLCLGHLSPLCRADSLRDWRSSHISFPRS